MKNSKFTTVTFRNAPGPVLVIMNVLLPVDNEKIIVWLQIFLCMISYTFSEYIKMQI